MTLYYHLLAFLVVGATSEDRHLQFTPSRPDLSLTSSQHHNTVLPPPNSFNVNSNNNIEDNEVTRSSASSPGSELSASASQHNILPRHFNSQPCHGGGGYHSAGPCCVNQGPLPLPHRPPLIIPQHQGNVGWPRPHRPPPPPIHHPPPPQLGMTKWISFVGIL